MKPFVPSQVLSATRLTEQDEENLFKLLLEKSRKREALDHPHVQRGIAWAEELHTGQWRKFSKEKHFDHTFFVGTAYTYFFLDDVEGIETAHLHDVEEDAHKYPKYLLKSLRLIDPATAAFPEFVKKNFGPLMREFLHNNYHIRINADGTVEFKIPAGSTPTLPKDMLIAALEDSITLNNPHIGGAAFTRFVANKVFEDGGGHDGQYGLFNLSRLSNDNNFNFAFIDPRMENTTLRLRMCSIKCFDVWHNMRTMDFTTPEGLDHAKNNIPKLIMLMPYLEHGIEKGGGDMRPYQLAAIALERAYAQWQEAVPGLPSLTDELAAAKADMESKLKEKLKEFGDPKHPSKPWVTPRMLTGAKP